MAKFLGVDIERELDKAFRKAGTPTATLIKAATQARTTGHLNAGTRAAPTSYTVRAIVQELTLGQINALGALAAGVTSGTTTGATSVDRNVLIFGGSLPHVAGVVSVVPEVGDQIAIEGDTLTVVHVTRDPAAATYLCAVG